MVKSSRASKVAVITGAASGLGRALACNLARQGWTIAVADINETGSEETLRQVRALGGDGACFRVDVTNAQVIEDLAEDVYTLWGRCDMLINNAGVASTGAIGKVPLEDWRWCIDIDLMGPIYGCHAFVPRMQRQGFGHIINVASIAGYAMGRRMGPYNVAKSGVIALSETLRAELEGTNIGVTVVCPGFFLTGIANTMRFTDKREQDATRKLTGGSNMTVEDVAAAVLKTAQRGGGYVVMPRYAQMIFWARRLFPAGATALLSRISGRRKS